MTKRERNKTIVIVSLLSILAGLTVMTGWLWGLPPLESMVPGFDGMRFNSALCFVLFGTALLLTQFRSSRLNDILFYLFSSIGTVIGLLTLSQDIFHYTSGIDQLFVFDKSPVSYAIPFPGRMAFNASFGFFVLGAGFLTLKVKGRQWALLSQLSFHLVTILSAVSLIGYLYGVSFFRVFLYKTSMAVHTAFIFLLLSIAASLFRPDVGITSLFTGKKMGNQLARRLFGLMLLMVVIFGSLRVQSQRYDLFNSVNVGISVLAVSFLLVSLVLIWHSARWLNDVDKQRSEAEAKVRRMNEGLEKMVEERYAAYQKSEEKYHSLVEQASDAIFVIDGKGNFVDANASMCKMMGYKKEQLLKMSVAAILVPEELEQESLEKRMQRIEYSVVRERNFMRSNGEAFPAEINAKKASDDRIFVIARDVTYRKKIEAELRDAELRFRTIADKSMVGVYIVQHGKFTYVNPRFAAVFGYEPDELINTVPVEAIFHDSFKAAASENVRKRVSGEVESIHYEAMGLRKDGAANWVEFYGSRAVLNQVPTIMGSMIDVTERKKAEEQLRSSELKYKLLFESSPTPMWMIDKENRSIIAVNDAVAMLYGYNKNELLNSSVLELRPEEDRELQRAGYEKDFDYGSAPALVRHRKKDGSLIYVQISARDIIFEGRPVRLSMTIDMTEKLKAEEALRKSEANLQTILNTTDTAYALFDLDLNLLASNAKANEFIKQHYHQALYKGAGLSEYIPKARFPHFEDYALRVIKGESFTYEVDYPQANGSVLWYYMRMVPITNDDKEILGMLLALYDITERKKSEQHLKDAYERIHNHIESIKQMAWKQSHLIRSPLANLKGLTAILKDTPNEKAVYEHIEQELNRMDGILIEMAKEAAYHD